MEQNKHRHRAAADRMQVYTWLGAGAVAVGIGAALAAGSGIAQADITTADNRSVSAADGGRAQGPIRVPAKSPHERASTFKSQLKSSGSPAPLATSTSAGLHGVPLESSPGSAQSSPNPRTRVASAKRSPDQVIGSRASAMALALSAAATTAMPKSAAADGAAAVSNAAPRGKALADTAVTDKDMIDIGFSGLNGSIGWIPVVGTAINALKFAIDTLSLASSVVTLNFPQVLAESANLVVDTIGLVPVAGGPIASLLSQTVLGGNVKFGTVIQQGLQSVLASNTPWSNYPLSVDVVDVAVGLFGSQAGTATVSKLNGSSGGVLIDVINTGFQTGWSIPLEGRLQLLAVAYS